VVALTSFVVGLCLLLRRVEGEPAWRSTVALVFGALFAAFLFTNTSGSAAGNRGADLDPSLAHFAFDMGNLGFANAWVSMGTFAAFSGWVVLRTRVFRPWLGWLMVVSGVGLALSRFVWTTDVWLLPYALFWIWVVAACVLCSGKHQLSTGQSRVEQPQGRTYGNSELNLRWRQERIRSSATLASTPSTVAAPPAIKAHRGPRLSATQPRIGEPIAVPPNSTMM
jgi:hypothetical protein